MHFAANVNAIAISLRDGELLRERNGGVSQNCPWLAGTAFFSLIRLVVPMAVQVISLSFRTSIPVQFRSSELQDVDIVTGSLTHGCGMIARTA